MKSKKLRASAEGQDCTLQIAGVCNGNPATVVLVHLPDESHGMAKKSDDISACFGCSSCHDLIDGRSGRFGGWDSPDKDFYFRRAMIRTWRIWINDGLVKLP